MNILVISVHPKNDGRLIKHIGFCKKIYGRVQYLRINIQNDNNICNLLNEIEYIELDIAKRNKIMQYLSYLIIGLIRAGRLIKSPDIIHTHDPQSLLVGSLIKHFYAQNARLVYDRHEKWHETFFPAQNRIIEKIAANKIDGIVCVTSEMKESLPSYFPNVPKIIVPNWPLRSMVDQKEVEKKIRSTLAQSKTNIVYMGYLDNERTREMLSLLEMLANSEMYLNIIIGGRGPAADKIDKLARKYNSIEYLGHIPYEEVVNRTIGAHFGLIFTDLDKNTKTSNNKLNEYLLCGVYPIAKINEEDYSPDWPFELMNKRDILEIYNIIRKAYADRIWLARKLCEIRDFGLSRCWENIEMEYEKLYDRILQAKA